MGRRILSVDIQVLANLLKQSDRVVSFTVKDNPLPDDAKVTGIEDLGWPPNKVGLILESESWWGDSREPLPQPSVVVHYEEAGDDAN